MRRKSLTHPAVLLPLACIVGTAAVVLAVWVLPQALTSHLSAGMSAADRLKSENDARSPVIAAIAIIGAATITAVYAAHSARQTLEGQLADRYSKAIDQLDDKKALDVRIGGIYALERIAQDSPRGHHPTVMEVLTSYVQEHSRELWPEAQTEPPPRLTRPDVQAAVTVIGRRDSRHDQRWLRLSHAALTSADLVNADLRNADLTSADLCSAALTYADLTHAFLKGAHLTGAQLEHASLFSAYLADAALSGAVWADDPIPEGWTRDPDSGRLSRASGHTDDADS